MQQAKKALTLLCNPAKCGKNAMFAMDRPPFGPVFA
jgi:hypothetical protein